MTRAPLSKKYHEMDRVDRAIAEFASLEKPTVSDLNRVRTISQVEEELDRYRADGKEMTEKELVQEAHNSARLGKHMRLSGDPRPPQSV